MSRFKSLLTSTLFTIISTVSLTLTVLGQVKNETNGHDLDPVGGVVTAANKLAIVAPYLVLAGIVAVASAIYIKRRKH
ncbi:MAG: hypothetical protein NWE90_05665 [Candidatus Bathyarchaeota archaeon]|nr:hypothetical protein [Candidatus Bathyarchaeota archaeon]